MLTCSEFFDTGKLFARPLTPLNLLTSEMAMCIPYPFSSLIYSLLTSMKPFLPLIHRTMVNIPWLVMLLLSFAPVIVKLVLRLTVLFLVVHTVGFTCTCSTMFIVLTRSFPWKNSSVPEMMIFMML